MSEDTYKGESPSKKLARFMFWSLALKMDAERRRLLKQPPSIGRHVFLASRVGGDASVLRGLGVPDGRMLAVERNEDAANEFRKRWPDVPLVVGDISDVLESDEFRDQSAIVFLDFCAPICAPTLETIRRVNLAVTDGTILGVALLRGRETKSDSIEVMPNANRTQRRIARAVNRGHIRRILNSGERIGSIANHLANGGQASPSALIDVFKDRNNGSADGSRHGAIQYLLALDPRNPSLHVWHAISYQSNVGDSRGVPMSIALMSQEESVQNKCGFRIQNASVRDLAHLRKIALNMHSQFGEAVPLLLNIDPSTFAAWRAHATRGTYEKRSA